jgi:hypothetical protein
VVDIINCFSVQVAPGRLELTGYYVTKTAEQLKSLKLKIKKDEEKYPRISKLNSVIITIASNFGALTLAYTILAILMYAARITMYAARVSCMLLEYHVRCSSFGSGRESGDGCQGTSGATQ